MNRGTQQTNPSAESPVFYLEVSFPEAKLQGRGYCPGPVFLCSGGLGRIAHCPILGAWIAGTSCQSDNGAPAPAGYPLDRQKPAVHPDLYRPLYHGPMYLRLGTAAHSGR